MIISRTPFRISFFGGGTDYPQWYREHGGAVIASTINHYCYISCRHLPPFFDHNYRIAYSVIETTKTIEEIKHPSVRAILNHLEYHDSNLEILYNADLPARSGLGTSSSFTVGLLNALQAMKGQYITDYELAKLAIHIEQDIIKEAVGSQDQTLAAYGGFKRVEFNRDNSIRVDPIILKQNRIQQLENHLMLFFTGFARYASEIAKTKINNFKVKQDSLHTMRQMVEESIDILTNEHKDIVEFGKLLHHTWELKRGLSASVSNDTIDDIYLTARKAGATGGKILGAGGGGFMLLFVKPELQTSVREALKFLLHIPFKFEEEGSTIVLYQPNGFRE